MFLVPIGSFLFYTIDIVLIITLGISFYLCLLIFVQSKINFLSFQKLTASHLKYGDYLSILCLISLLSFFIIEYVIIQRQTKSYLKELNDKIKERQSQRFRIENEKLLNEITSFIIENKLYTKYDLTIQTLCKMVGKSYFEVSKILKNNNIASYKTYINTIKIEKVIDRINKGALDSYTLQSLYKENGFEYQSTFNRVFKDITGETPTDFIRKNSIKN
jgi:AraC-like DNA-binding protein